MHNETYMLDNIRCDDIYPRFLKGFFIEWRPSLRHQPRGYQLFPKEKWPQAALVFIPERQSNLFDMGITFPFWNKL